VLADEPTGNLDPDSAAAVIALLRDCLHAEGATGVLVTHSRTAAARADRALPAHRDRTRGGRAVIAGGMGRESRDIGRRAWPQPGPARAVGARHRARRRAGFAVALINQVAVAEFTSGMKTLSGLADLEVRGPRGGFDETLFAQLARDPGDRGGKSRGGDRRAHRGRDDSLRIYGVDAFRAAAVTPALVGAADDALDVLRPGVAFVSPAAAAWLGYSRRHARRANRRERHGARRRGIRPRETGERLCGDGLSRRPRTRSRAAGLLSRIDLRARPGVDVPGCASAWRARCQPE
jgi:hypothetical protein